MTGNAYWIATVDGGVRVFGDARFDGDAVALHVHGIGMAVVPPKPA